MKKWNSIFLVSLIFIVLFILTACQNGENITIDKAVDTSAPVMPQTTVSSTADATAAGSISETTDGSDNGETTTIRSTTEENSGTASQTVSQMTTEALTDGKKDRRYSGSWILDVDTLYAMTAMEVYYGTTRIDLDVLSDGTVNGVFYAVSSAPSYRQAEVLFTGTFENGILEADYEDEGWLYGGHLTIKTPEDGSDASLQVTITRTSGDMNSNWGIPEGEFSFRRAIETAFVDLSETDLMALTDLFSMMTQDRMPPFTVENGEDTLTEAAKINFIGLNIADGKVNVSLFGDLVDEGAEITFDASVMQSLLEEYIGTTVTEPQSTTFVTYDSGRYTVPAIGGVTESPEIQFIMQDTGYQGRYYAVVNYKLPGSDEVMYQNLMTIEFYNGYHVRGIERIDDPVDTEMLNAMR